MGDQHVDGRLGDLVDRHAEAGRDGRVEVRDLDLDQQPHPPALLATRQVGDRERQEAAAAAGAGDQQPVADPPAHAPVVAREVVLGGVEAQQGERPPEEHDRAFVLAVDHADRAQGHTGEEPPVGARQVLEVGGVPHPLPIRIGERELGQLHGPDRPVARHHGRLGRRDDDRLSGGAAPAPAAGRHERGQRGEQCDERRHDRIVSGFNGPGAPAPPPCPPRARPRRRG